MNFLNAIEQALNGGGGGRNSQQRFTVVAINVFKLPVDNPVRQQFIELIHAERARDREAVMRLVMALDAVDAISVAIHYYHDHDLLDHMESMADHSQMSLYDRLPLITATAQEMQNMIETAHRYVGTVTPELMAEFPMNEETATMLKAVDDGRG